MSLRRKLTLRAHHQSLILIKQPQEKLSHVLMKAFLWALYLPEYPDLRVEVPAGLRYKPDVLALDSDRPAFWGEAGAVSPDKYRYLLRHQSHTHFAFARWGIRLPQHLERIQAQLKGIRRHAPVDVLVFPEDSETRFILDGEIQLDFSQLNWRRLEP